jgi:PTH2 family peptidyl-tRNA hydrolase
MIKQVIVVNGALTMSAGKLAAQVAHAAVGGVWDCDDRPDVMRSWLRGGTTKIVLRAASAEALGILCGLAEEADLPNALVVDEGRTEIPPGSVTCLAIGPAEEEAINKITGNLPLYR